MDFTTSYTEEIDEKPVWVAKLSNGQFVYQNDKDEPDWLRLREFLLKSEEIWITGLHFRFRSNIIYPIPDNQEGYFFCNKLVQKMNGKPLDFYVGGYFSGNKIYTQTFKVPELFVVESQIREYEEKYHLFSIRNKYGLGKS